MNKLSTLIGILFFSIPAYSMPSVGDFNKMDITITDSATGRVMVDGDTSLELTAFDSATNHFNLHTIMNNKLDGSSFEENNDQDKEELPTESTIAMILQFCTQSGGTLETLTTPMGNIETCAMPIDDDDQKGTIWLGSVPFGQVKMDTFSKKKVGYHVQTLLREYRFGR